MNEEIKELKTPNIEDQESDESSRSPGVTDRGLTSSENLSSKKNITEPSKNIKTDEPIPPIKPSESKDE